MKDVLNVKPVLLKQNALEMDAFQQRLFNSQRETYFLLNLFCVTQCPQDGCLYERWSQCEASSFKEKMHPKWMPFSKDFLILGVKPIFC